MARVQATENISSTHAIDPGHGHQIGIRTQGIQGIQLDAAEMMQESPHPFRPGRKQGRTKAGMACQPGSSLTAGQDHHIHQGSGRPVRRLSG